MVMTAVPLVPEPPTESTAPSEVAPYSRHVSRWKRDASTMPMTMASIAAAIACSLDAADEIRPYAICSRSVYSVGDA